MSLLYGFFFSIFALLYLPIFFLKGKAKGGVGSRFGRVDANTIEKLKNQKVLWIHAVSVGEVALAVRLMNHWRGLFPGKRFVLTTTTVTGFEVASRSVRPEDTVLQFPVDFRFSVRRFVRSVHPEAVVFMETEIWPNLIWELSSRKIPFMILNGRISDKAIGKYRPLQFFLKPLLKRFTGIGVQDETMRSRFLELGADPAKVEVTGNLKFDWEPPKEIPTETQAVLQRLVKPGQFLLIAASTHEGEEGILLGIFEKIRKNHPGFRLLLAPRHPERLESVEKLAMGRGIRLKRVFSSPQNGYDEGSADPWLLDRMGVLAHLYGAADAVFVGGSLVPTGGHNPVEPAFYGKPVSFGPYMNNFSDMSRLFLSGGAALESAGAEELEKNLVFWIQNPEERRNLGDRARQLVAGHRGALGKNTGLFASCAKGDFLK